MKGNGNTKGATRRMSTRKNSVKSPDNAHVNDGKQDTPGWNSESELSIPLTDIGNKRRFVEANKAELRRSDCWLRWDGKRWERIDDDQVLRHAEKTVELMEGEIQEAFMKRCLEKLTKWHDRSQSLPRLKAMIKLAQSDGQLKVDAGRFDSMPRLLNLPNGTLNLDTFKLQPHRRDDLLTRVAPTKYAPGAECPLFRSFIETIFAGDRDLMAYVQRALGYALLGSNPEHALFVLHGDGANGKSVLLQAVRAAIGLDYATQGNASTLIAGGRGTRIRDDLANLKGYRFVAMSETDDAGRLDEALVKWITGGEPIRCRKLYQNEIEYLPQFTIYLATNHRPAIRNTDKGIWRRIHLVPFGVSIPEEEQDTALQDKLAEEREGILVWLLDGLKDYLDSGLRPPVQVADALRLYHEDSDLLGHFLAADCVTGAQEKAGARELYEAYQRYAVESADSPLNLREFKRQMQRRGFSQIREGKGIFWKGIGVRPTVGSHAASQSKPAQALAPLAPQGQPGLEEASAAA